MVDARVFRWASGVLVEDDWCDPHAGRVRVADSFLVLDGQAVHAERHVERFATSLANVAPDLDGDAFARDALGAIPSEGRWFPRLEAVTYGDGDLLRVHLRPAPERETEVTVATAARDPRNSPFVKGPDLTALGVLRAETSAGEAVILDGGFIAEGAWSSIVWWQNDTLHVVDKSTPRLPSITERTLIDHARYIGAPVIESRVTPGDLTGAEVWILSALHGIRVVTAWIGGPELHSEPGRVEYWRQQYERRRTTIL